MWDHHAPQLKPDVMGAARAQRGRIQTLTVEVEEGALLAARRVAVGEHQLGLIGGGGVRCRPQAQAALGVHQPEGDELIWGWSNLAVQPAVSFAATAEGYPLGIRATRSAAT